MTPPPLDRNFTRCLDSESVLIFTRVSPPLDDCIYGIGRDVSGDLHPHITAR